MKQRTISKTLVVIISILLLSSCLNRNIESESDLNICKQEVMYKSDEISYIQLTNYFINDSNYFELLPYSIKMMQESKFGYFDFYYTYMRIRFNNKYDINNFLKMNKDEKRFLINILSEGSREGNFRCDDVLKEFYKLGVIDSTMISVSQTEKYK